MNVRVHVGLQSSLCVCGGDNGILSCTYSPGIQCEVRFVHTSLLLTLVNRRRVFTPFHAPS